MDENTQVENSSEVSGVAPATTIDPKELAAEVANILRPQKEEPAVNFDDMEWDKRDEHLKQGVDRAQQSADNAHATVRALLSIDSVSDKVLQSIPEGQRAASKAHVDAVLKEIALENASVLQHADNPEFKRVVAERAAGKAALSGAFMVPDAEGAGKPNSTMGIPNAEAITKAFREVHKREPSIDELKEYSSYEGIWGGN